MPLHAAVERPVSQFDWVPRDPRDILSVIAASCSSADLLAMLALVPNVTPRAETAPVPGAGNNPQEEDKHRSCLDRRPASAVGDNGGKGGWIDCWAMEDVVDPGAGPGASVAKRPAGAHGCLAGP
ncbi:hypothetical protein [Kitasatospora sp. NPDC088548]|uniref:hypothetical protein n=1 Tax=Kitasatospora sp. NPDC088548 TaxID=3364075 RepID=UPI003805E9FC